VDIENIRNFLTIVLTLPSCRWKSAGSHRLGVRIDANRWRRL